ncbi:MAG: endonuclease I family protein [Pseudobdellovibrionaceae bacterium]|jgi:hypothetical protein
MLRSFVTILLSILFLGLAAQAGKPPTTLPMYYGEDFYRSKDNLKDDTLRVALNEILRGGHVSSPKGYDKIVHNCTAQNSCYQHSPVGYGQARKELFGNLHLQENGGDYAVTEVYCDFRITSKQAEIGPGQVPSANLINAEHTWPQSRFTNRYPKDVQKCDLHHLFPTDSQMNSLRSSLRFGEVLNDVERLKCNLSKLGRSESGEIVFEPPHHHKGNVARAIFYFATRYEMRISDSEEAFLRKWNQEDPVDEAEYLRNEEIFKIQKVRNPFIDFPELVEQVSNF